MKKSLMENFIFCAVLWVNQEANTCKIKTPELGKLFKVNKKTIGRCVFGSNLGDKRNMSLINPC